jgi:hypothetical protein
MGSQHSLLVEQGAVTFPMPGVRKPSNPKKKQGSTLSTSARTPVPVLVPVLVLVLA